MGTSSKYEDYDLSQFDEEFANAPTEDPDKKDYGEDPPDGKYQVIVDTVNLTTSQAGNLMLKWYLKILGPTQAGRMLFKNHMLSTKENIEWLKKDLFTVNPDSATWKLSELRAHLAALLDVTLEVQQKTKNEFKNLYINKRIEVDATSTPTGMGVVTVTNSATSDDLPF